MISLGKLLVDWVIGAKATPKAAVDEDDDDSSSEDETSDLSGADTDSELDSSKAVKSTLASSSDFKDNGLSMSGITSNDFSNSRKLETSPSPTTSSPAPTPAQSNFVKMVGQITRIPQGFKYGIVDENYRFSLEKFKGFKVYDKVQYHAVQNEETEEWWIQNMELYKSPTDQVVLQTLKHKSHIYKVQGIPSKGKVIVKRLDGPGELQFNFDPDHQVVPGDWIKVVTEEGGSEDYCRVISIDVAQRKLVANGAVKRVNYGNDNYRIIDNHVFVRHANICDDKKFPAHGDTVWIEAIQSSQQIGDEKYEWRAIRLFRKVEEYLGFYRQKNEDDYIEQCITAGDETELLVKPLKTLSFHDVKLGIESVAQLSFTLLNQSTENTYKLLNVRTQRDQNVAKFTVHMPHRESDEFIAILPPGRTINIPIQCEALLIGKTMEFCFLEFEHTVITRKLRVAVVPLESEMQELVEKLKDKSQAIGRDPLSEKLDIEKTLQIFSSTARKRIYGGIKPVRKAFFLSKLDPAHTLYAIPDYIIECYKTRNADILYQNCPTLRTLENSKERVLTRENYCEMLHVALWFEEYFHLDRRERHSFLDVILEKEGDLFGLEIPGLKDIYPPFAPGDPISMTDSKDPTGGIYDANICKITETKLYFKLNEMASSKYGNGSPISIHFRIGRTSYKRTHFAIDKMIENLGYDWLFPETTYTVQEPRIEFLETGDNDEVEVEIAKVVQGPGQKLLIPLGNQTRKQKDDQGTVNSNSVLDRRAPSLRLPKLESRRFPKSKLETSRPASEPIKGRLQWVSKTLNDEQKRAVRMILRGQARPLPYIIFGPPGTGKTFTVVESIIQIYRLDPNSRVLVVAPSNSACDQISKYLIEIGKFCPGEFVRLLGFSRAVDTVPEFMREYCFDGNSLDNVCQRRIIVSTCNTAGQFFQLGLFQSHFSHVFVDEAGYCYEPDTIVPLVLVSLDRNSQIVLAGDPNQLGPTVFSDFAATFCLTGSLLERFMKLELYSRKKSTKKYDDLLITKLLVNYRAHPELLKLPSKLFYDNELIAAGVADTTFAKLHFLERQGIPIIFHGVRATQSRDPDSRSWYNKTEVKQVVDYTKLLLNSGCSPNDIGIITPYRKQVEKICTMLSSKLQCRLPKVGSVEEFQGGEREIIIVSLVRTMEVNDELETLEKMSFALSPRRFNVCLTRAKNLLIVIGDPKLFSIHYVWNKFLKHCIKHGVYRGSDLPNSLIKYYRKYYRNRKYIGSALASIESDDSEEGEVPDD